MNADDMSIPAGVVACAFYVQLVFSASQPDSIQNANVGHPGVADDTQIYRPVDASL